METSSSTTRIFLVTSLPHSFNASFATCRESYAMPLDAGQQDLRCGLPVRYRGRIVHRVRAGRHLSPAALGSCGPMGYTRGYTGSVTASARIACQFTLDWCRSRLHHRGAGGHTGGNARHAEVIRYPRGLLTIAPTGMSCGLQAAEPSLTTM